MMATQQTSQQKRLKDGVQALKRGDRGRARKLLLQAVQQAGGDEAAWWHLYQAVDDPREQMTALEGVLRANPQHPEAHARLEQLRRRELERRPRSANLPWESVLPQAPVEVDDGIDNAYQCAYCGVPTGLEARRCPGCGHALYRRVARSRRSGALNSLLLLLSVSLAAGLMEMLGPVFALTLQQGRTDPFVLSLLLRQIAATLIVGDVLALPAAALWLLVQIHLARAGLLVVILAGLRERWTLAYYAAMLGALADLLLSLYLFINEYLGLVGALFNAGLALTSLVIVFASSYEFAVHRERLLVKPDGAARSALDFFRRGHEYRRRGMWALAVAQWRRAVGLAPNVTRYYKDLGIGYAQIGRFDRSLRALEEAQRQAPADAEIGEIIALVRTRAERHSLLQR